MRLTFQDRQSAQAVADRIFADMKAAGALEPGTFGWANPEQDLTEAQKAEKAAWNPVVKEGDPVPMFEVQGTWYLLVKPRCAKYLTSKELALLPELSAALLATTIE